MVRLLAAGGAAGLGTMVGELTAHGYPGYVVIAVVGLLGLSVAGSAVLRLCETRAKRSPAQVKAAAVTRAARRVADPERALRLLLGTPADQSGDGGQTTADTAACPAIRSENRQPPENVPSSDL